MAIGIVSDEDLEKELENISGEVRPLRKERSPNVPESLRKIIGGTSIEHGRKEAVELAESFGIGEGSVSAYSNGATSLATYNEPNQALMQHIRQTRDTISERAQKTLLTALDELTADRLEETKPRDLASIAKDMSSIVKNMDDKNNGAEDKGVKFVVYAPTITSEDKFETVKASE